MESCTHPRIRYGHAFVRVALANMMAVEAFCDDCKAKLAYNGLDQVDFLSGMGLGMEVGMPMLHGRYRLLIRPRKKCDHDSPLVTMDSQHLPDSKVLVKLSVVCKDCDSLFGWDHPAETIEEETSTLLLLASFES